MYTQTQKGTLILCVFHIHTSIYTQSHTETHIKAQPSYREGIARCHSHSPMKVRQNGTDGLFALNQQLFRSVVKHAHMDLIPTLTHFHSPRVLMYSHKHTSGACDTHSHRTTAVDFLNLIMIVQSQPLH